METNNRELLEKIQDLFAHSKFDEVYDMLRQKYKDGELEGLADPVETNPENDLRFLLARTCRFTSRFDESQQIFGELIKEANGNSNYKKSFRVQPFYADSLRCSGDLDGAKAFLGRSFKEYERLLNQGKMDKEGLFEGTANLELAKMEEKSPDKKQKYLDEAEKSLKEYMQTDSNSPIYSRRFFHTITEQRVPVLLSQGKHEDASKLYGDLINNASKDPRMDHEKYSSMLGLALLNTKMGKNMKEVKRDVPQIHEYFKNAGYKGSLWSATYCEIKAAKSLGENPDRKLIEREPREWKDYIYNELDEHKELKKDLDKALSPDKDGDSGPDR